MSQLLKAVSSQVDLGVYGFTQAGAVMDYAKAFKIIRVAKGLTQKELAEQLDLDTSFISLLECGRRKPSMDTLEAIAECLDVPIYLISLIASEKKDLRGIEAKEAQKLGMQLLDVVL